MQTRPRLFYSEHCNVNVLVNMSLHVFKKKNFFLILFPEGWAWPPHTEICRQPLRRQSGACMVRQETVWITTPKSQHHLPNRITQHNKLHKIIKLITTLNPSLIHSIRLNVWRRSLPFKPQKRIVLKDDRTQDSSL